MQTPQGRSAKWRMRHRTPLNIFVSRYSGAVMIANTVLSTYQTFNERVRMGKIADLRWDCDVNIHVKELCKCIMVSWRVMFLRKTHRKTGHNYDMREKMIFILVHHPTIIRHFKQRGSKKNHRHTEIGDMIQSLCCIIEAYSWSKNSVNSKKIN